MVSQFCFLVGPVPGQSLCTCCVFCLSPHICLENSYSPFTFWLRQCLLPKIVTDPFRLQVDIGAVTLSRGPDTLCYINTDSFMRVCSSVTQGPGNSVNTALSLSLSPSPGLIGLCYLLGTIGPENFSEISKSLIPKNQMIGSRTRRENLQ